MKVRLIRNATLVLDYAGHRLLLDPDLAQKHARPSFTGRSENPMVDLPLPMDTILDGIEAVLVSHLHADHFDRIAKDILSKGLPIFCQPDNDARIAEAGFKDVRVIDDTTEWHGIRITRINGHHGLGSVEERMGAVSGFVFSAPDAPTLYWAGDTVWCDEVQAAIDTHQPDVIITHSCGAMWSDDADEKQYIVMDAAQTIQVCQHAPDSLVIATHMEALDHSTVSRAELRQAAVTAGITNAQLRIPDDGELIEV